jgi:hypothetical protein
MTRYRDPSREMRIRRRVLAMDAAEHLDTAFDALSDAGTEMHEAREAGRDPDRQAVDGHMARFHKAWDSHCSAMDEAETLPAEDEDDDEPTREQAWRQSRDSDMEGRGEDDDMGEVPARSPITVGKVARARDKARRAADQAMALDSAEQAKFQRFMAKHGGFKGFFGIKD